MNKPQAFMKNKKVKNNDLKSFFTDNSDFDRF